MSRAEIILSDGTNGIAQVPNSLDHQPGFRIRRGLNWLMLGLTYASYYACRYNISIASSRIVNEFGLSNARFGAINTGRHWAYAIGQFINGLLTDRLGGKQALALGAALTIVLNVAFGMASFAGAGSVLFLFILIRSCDGYAQAFGAPGMIKVNTAWFPPRERGRFAGIYGLMIQLGQISINTFGPLLLVGCTIPLVLVSFKVPALHWRWLFWVPPMVVAVVTLLMYAIVKNNPEGAGYAVPHELQKELGTEAGETDAELTLWEIFNTIVRRKMVWVTAGAYFCTGVVRTAQYDWWVLYFDKVWGLDIAHSTLVAITAALLPITALVGSLGSGYISDVLFKGKRAPVAVGLYGIESVVILAAALGLGNKVYASASLAAVMMLLISLTCNSTHSILGTAAAMDIGGRKMAGFASGVIDCFQYLGAGITGLGLGWLIDWAVVNTTLGWNVWFFFMLPFSLFGMILMAVVSYRIRGRQEHA